MSPITKLFNEIELVFSNSKNSFREIHLKAINSGKIQKGIGLTQFPTKFHGPKVNMIEKKIIINEDFLSYLWVIIYFVVYRIDSSRNPDYCNLSTGQFKIENNEVNKLYRLFKWGLNLSHFNHSEWDKSLPNPEISNQFTENENKIINNTNVIFPVSVSYLLFHEFAHLYYEHPLSSQCSSDESKMYEKEADTFARRMIYDNSDTVEVKKTASFAVLCANLSLLFFKNSNKTLVSDTHPDVDSRIFDAFTDMNIEIEDIGNLLAEAFCSTCITFFSIYNIPIDIKPHYENRNEGIEIILKTFDSMK